MRPTEAFPIKSHGRLMCCKHIKPCDKVIIPPCITETGSMTNIFYHVLGRRTITDLACVRGKQYCRSPLHVQMHSVFRMLKKHSAQALSNGMPGLDMKGKTEYSLVQIPC